MDSTIKMAAYPRHSHIVMSLFPNVLDLFKQKRLYPLQEENILVFRGKKYSGEEELIDVEQLGNICEFLEFGVDLLDYVQPDFLFFMNNSFLQTRTQLKTIGVPDLVIEVWSAGNEQIEREMKFRVYSSNEKCEHWYIEQNFNTVECYLGKQKLKNQSLEEIMTTQHGIEFDLRHLAL